MCEGDPRGVRTLGIERGLKINEYGVYRGSRQIAGRTEEEVYASVGLPWIPPELREDRGEIEAARRGALPRLVELQDLRGDLQMHTTASDGRNTLEEMVEACVAQWAQCEARDAPARESHAQELA